MSEPNPPSKLEYHPQDSKQFLRAERKRETLLYVKRMILAIFHLMAAIVALGVLYIIIYVVSLGGGGPIR
jgi:lipopolysaccharide/colanic/teichoic acid biosynthesis glycosyltransferase